MEVDEQRDCNDLELLFEAPPFWTYLEIWNYILDKSKELSKRASVLNRAKQWYLSESDDLDHGHQIIGRNDIKNVFPEMYNDFVFEQSEGKRRNTEKLGNSQKLSHLFRFLRNITQHSEENMSEETFRKYFPKSYENKENFVRSVLNSLPTLLIYTWNMEKHKLQDVLEPICFQFTQVLKHSLDHYLKENRLCQLCAVIKRRSVVMDIVKLDSFAFERLYGTVVSVRKENCESFIEVIREHKDESTRCRINGPPTFPRYNILFGAHKINTDTALDNYVFVKDSNLEEVVRQLDMGCRDNHEEISIEPTGLLKSYITQTGSMEINGALIPLRNIETYADEILEDLDYPEWRQLIMNQPLRLFNQNITRELSLPGNESEALNFLNGSSEQFINITRGTPVIRTSVIKKLHYELGRSNLISIFVTVARLIDVTRQSPNTLKERLINFLGTSEAELIILEKMFSGSFSNTTIILDGIDNIPDPDVIDFAMSIRNFRHIRIVATSEATYNHFYDFSVEEIRINRHGVLVKM